MKNFENRKATALKEKMNYYSGQLSKLQSKVLHFYGNDAFIGFLLLQSNYVNPKWITVTATEIAVVKNLLDEESYLTTFEVLKKANTICNEKLHRNFQNLQFQNHGYTNNVFSFLTSYDSNDFEEDERNLLKDYFIEFANIKTQW